MYGIINGKIYTVDGTNWDKKPVSAMAIQDGKIAKLGTDEEIISFIGEQGEVKDLKGNVVLPGFVDSHVHIPGTSLSEMFQIVCYGIFELDGTLECIKKYIDEHPDQEEYFGNGFNMGLFNDSDDVMPCELIDEITNKPVNIQSYDGHSKWLNSAAMKKYGIDESTKTAGSGHIHKNKDGKLTGIFTDVSDIGIANVKYTREQETLGFKHFIKKMNKWGYTSIMSVTPLFDSDLYTYLEVPDEDLTLRVSIAPFIHPDNQDDDLETAKKIREDIATDKLKVTTAKYMVDGVLEGNTAYLKEPYSSEAGLGDNYNSDPEWDYENLRRSFKDAMNEGFQLHCHTIGDATIDMTLSALEELEDVCDVKTKRNVFTHLHVVDYKDIDRMKKLEIIAAIQPFWHLREPGFFEVVELPALGEERVANKMYPAKTFVNKGIKITSSGDYPVSYINNPFMGIRAGVTRNLWSKEYYGEEITDIDDPRFLLRPEERLSVKDMIESYTINGAFEIFREEEVGSLAVGKKADYIVIDRDILNISPLEIDTTKVIETVFAGVTCK